MRRLSHFFNRLRLVAQILHVNISSEPHVIREIPTVVIRIFIDRNVVRIPVPVAHVIVIIRSYAEKESVKSETLAVAAVHVPNVFTSEPTGEMSVLPGMVDMVVDIVATRTVSHPCFSTVHVRRIRMARLIIKMSFVIMLFWLRRWCVLWFLVT